tara:strand:+ start:178 stop:453 length:276 start_codon:yes stop_codon:yes gene_type:complete
MIQKLKILDETLNQLDEINKVGFLYEDFKKVNSELEKILVDLKSENLTLQNNKFSEEYRNIYENTLNKIDNLESKILPKANLLNSFTNSNL